MYHLNVVDIDRFEEKLREVEASVGLTGSQGTQVEYSRSSETTSVLFTKLLLGAIVVAIIFSLGGGVNMPKMDAFVSCGGLCLLSSVAAGATGGLWLLTSVAAGVTGRLYLLTSIAAGVTGRL